MDYSYPRWMRSSSTSARLIPLKLNSSSTRYTEGSAEICFTCLNGLEITHPRVGASEPDNVRQLPFHLLGAERENRPLPWYLGPAWLEAGGYAIEEFEEQTQVFAAEVMPALRRRAAAARRVSAGKVAA